MAVGSSPETVMGMADRDPAWWSGMAGAVPAKLHHEQYREHHAGVVLTELTQLGKSAEAALDTQPVHDATTMRSQHFDSKSRRELQDKRIALGHKLDDHEEPQWQQRM